MDSDNEFPTSDELYNSFITESQFAKEDAIEQLEVYESEENED